MLESIYHNRNNTLLLQLEKTLESDFHRYEETREVKSCGVYMVYDNEDKVIYVGKTTRTISKRLSELSNGGHTLHKKLLRNLLGETLKRPSLKQKDVEEFKKENKEEFKKNQDKIKIKVKNDFRYKFCKVEQARLAEVEHFFIAIINPEYND